MNIQQSNFPVVENIKRIIRDKGIKQSYVSQKLGVEKQAFTNMLGGRKVIKISDVVALCEILDIFPNDLFLENSKIKAG